MGDFGIIYRVGRETPLLIGKGYSKFILLVEIMALPFWGEARFLLKIMF
tara:strand:- start:492 stop:638 length:147 start_codon:yes stop_codon:yes gene_type:complete